MKVDAILSRVHHKPTGHGRWMCKCPAHDDKTASLSVFEADDGRVLINCFAGCSTESVLGAIGLDWGDVMPDKVADHIKPERQRLYASEALIAIGFEARYVFMAAYELAQGKPLEKENMERLKVAMRRINTALEAANVQP